MLSFPIPALCYGRIHIKCVPLGVHLARKALIADITPYFRFSRDMTKMISLDVLGNVSILAPERGAKENICTE
jgi:hypothetical protein